MFPLKNGVVSLLLILSSFCWIQDTLSEGRVVCYYTNWSVYRPGTAKYNPQNINPYLCTHLIYAFGGFTKDNQMKPFDKYQDLEQGGYAKFTGLKTYNKQLKTMIAIGGWNEASSRFSPLVANPERRQQFIKNILKFLRQNHFDGIDLDWEYPAHREGGKAGDRENYAQFVQEMRAEFERESQKTGRTRLLITMAVPAGIEYIDKGYDIPKLNKYLDWFNVLTYDFHSSEEASVNHHAPLYSLEEASEYNYDSELNIDYSIKYYLKAGADRDKLVLGIPTYGRSYTLINEESTELGAPAEAPGDQGDATREKGYLAYYEICQNIKDDPEWTVVQPNPNVMGPYAYRRNQWVGFDDEAIVRKKAAYAVDHGLGGIMFWAIDNDDFRGTCTGKPYPLIEAAKDEMLSLLGLGINEVSKPGPPKKPVRSRSRDNTAASRNRISEDKPSSNRNSLNRNRKTSTTSTSTTTPSTTTIKLTEAEGSSLYVGGRTTTPAPPTTPDPGADFKCEEEGFFQHPRDCKKYYWCLDSGPSGLGIVAHQFVCPSGLYFNPAADSCDFARNVPCKTKKSTTPPPTSLPATSTTTTPRSTESPVPYKNNFYRTSTTPKITTLKTTRTTTTSTTEKYEPEYEYEDSDDEIGTISKDTDAEEDPMVLKELIQLIRKVGGIDELEKHLLRKEDGTIAFKQADVATNNPTTPATISKSLYDKVLSRPNTFNSIRNRFTSSSLFRTKSENKETSIDEKIQDDTGFAQVNPTEQSGSKYSSVLRNARPRPQNDGLDKLPEFDAFIKEKKQYVNISRNRPKTNNDEKEEVEETEDEDELYDDEEEKEDIKTTQRSITSARPSYASIRRTRPTVASDIEEEPPAQKVTQTQENRETEKSYATLNRRRGTTTTTTEKSRYNTVERVRFSPSTTPTTSTTTDSSIVNVDDEEETNSDDDEQQQENVRKQENANVVAATQKTQIYTTRNYANIGRRYKNTETSTAKIAADLSNTINDNNSLLETIPNQTLTSTTTTNTPIVTSTTITISTTQTTSNEIPDNISTKNPITIDKNETENSTSISSHSSTTTPYNILSSTVNDEDITTSTLTSSSTFIPTTTTNDYLTTTNTHTDEFVDEVTKKSEYQLNLSSTETPTESNTNKIQKSYKIYSRTIQPQQTTNIPPTASTTDFIPSNQILGTVSSPRPFGFPKRRLLPSSTTTLTPITEEPLSANKVDKDNANVVKTVTDVNSNAPKKYQLSPVRSPEEENQKQNQNQQQIVTNNPFNINIITRRPVLSVRRRIINSPETTTIQNHNELTTTEHDLNNKYNRHRITLSSSSSSPSPLTTAKQEQQQQHYVANKFKSLSNLTTPNTSVTDNLQRANLTNGNGKYATSGVRRRFQTRRLPKTTTKFVATTITTAKSHTKSITEETGEIKTTQNPLFRRRYNTGATHFPIIPTTTTLNQQIYSTLNPDDGVDQVAKSSIHASFFNQLRKAAEMKQEKDRIKTKDVTEVEKIQKPTKINDDITRRIDSGPIVTSTNNSLTDNSRDTKSRTLKPKTRYRESFNRVKNKAVKPQFKTQAVPRTAAIDFDYYDDDNISLLGSTQNQQLKVILHGPGIIECLDQGNFPHPLSCRKFISCAKYETGGVVGWEYTCPKGTSYDPVGGMCNWAVLGCKD